MHCSFFPFDAGISVRDVRWPGKEETSILWRRMLLADHVARVPYQLLCTLEGVVTGGGLAVLIDRSAQNTRRCSLVFITEFPHTKKLPPTFVKKERS
jgi:hypothetical protein